MGLIYFVVLVAHLDTGTDLDGAPVRAMDIFTDPFMDRPIEDPMPPPSLAPVAQHNKIFLHL